MHATSRCQRARKTRSSAESPIGKSADVAYFFATVALTRGLLSTPGHLTRSQMSFFKSRKGAKSGSMRSLNSSILDASTGSFTTTPQLQQPPIKIALGDSNLVFEDGSWSIGTYRVVALALG